MSTKTQQVEFTLEEYKTAIAEAADQAQELVLLVCTTSWREQAAILFKHLKPFEYQDGKKKIKSSEICHMIQGYGVQEMPRDIRNAAYSLFNTRTELRKQFDIRDDRNYLIKYETVNEYVQGDLVAIGKTFVKRPLLISTNNLYVIREAYKASKDKDWKITLLYQDGKKLETAKSFEDLIEKVGF